MWYILYAVQMVLIRNRNIRWHKLLGKLSLYLIIAVCLTGIYAIFRLNTLPEEIPFDLMKTEVGLFTLGLVYATLGYVFRYQPHNHKRFYLMSMIMLSPAGITRLMDAINFQPSQNIIYFLILFVIPLLIILLYDILAYKKVFIGTLIGIGIYALNLAIGGFWGSFIVEHIRPSFL